MSPSLLTTAGPGLRFVGLFLACVLGLTFFVQLSWTDQTLVLPCTESITRLSGSVLRLLGFPAQVQGTIIRQDHFGVDIRRGCDGIVASLLLVSACLAYPFTWKNRLLGTLWGYCLIFMRNLVRIVGLFIAGLKGSTQTFNFLHTYVSQFAVIALATVFGVFWAGREKAFHN